MDIIFSLAISLHSIKMVSLDRHQPIGCRRLTGSCVCQATDLDLRLGPVRSPYLLYGVRAVLYRFREAAMDRFLGEHHRLLPYSHPEEATQRLPEMAV